ncbi:glycoside hydrolase family 65 protein [Yunchengibacter salinarum]|uniref:glycoside hydrolase family 65 protein n=1 Tax=Yunchengibacter salinarum TaxID=3133399 RepID=UPI0035B6225A
MAACDTTVPPNTAVWSVSETDPTRESLLLNETLFALGNGYLGTRGTFEEGTSLTRDGGAEGTFLNGIYDQGGIVYPENAYGLARTHQSIFTGPDGKAVEIWVDGERLDIARGTLHAYERHLDYREGILRRTLDWEAPSGARVRLRFLRLASFCERAIIAQRMDMEAVTPCTIRLVSHLRDHGDLEDEAQSDATDSRKGTTIADFANRSHITDVRDRAAAMFTGATGADFGVVTAIDHVFSQGEPVDVASDRGAASFVFEAALDAGGSARLDKLIAITHDNHAAATETERRAWGALDRVRAGGIDMLAEEQKRYLAAFWESADIELHGDPDMQRALRFAGYHLLQGAGFDGRRGIAAKGLSSNGYDGHYFWDKEVYILPFFTYARPDIARSLLAYRCSMLEKARSRARDLGHMKGALIPWRTIGGEECSAYFPAGTAQYHINADIAYAIRQYVLATGDTDFLRHTALEVVLETARVWADVGFFNPARDDRFCIPGVTGPDEYTAIVDNNYYTNAMAAMHLKFAVSSARWLKEHYPQDYAALTQRLDLKDSELDFWQDAADKMYLPMSPDGSFIAQDDFFLSRPVWPFDETPKHHYPLLLHYHPLVIYRHQVCKQADAVMATFMTPDGLSADQIRATYDYYEPLTVHDSSLSPPIHSIMAGRLGMKDRAMDYFRETALVDIANTKGNTGDGVHTACMGGAWLAFASGFGGVTLHPDRLDLSPWLPEGWDGFTLPLTYRGRRLRLTVDEKSVTIALVAGEPLDVDTGNGPHRLVEGEDFRVSDGTASLKAPDAPVLPA